MRPAGVEHGCYLRGPDSLRHHSVWMPFKRSWLTPAPLYYSVWMLFKRSWLTPAPLYYSVWMLFKRSWLTPAPLWQPRPTTPGHPVRRGVCSGTLPGTWRGRCARCCRTSWLTPRPRRGEGEERKRQRERRGRGRGRGEGEAEVRRGRDKGWER